MVSVAASRIPEYVDPARMVQLLGGRAFALPLPAPDDRALREVGTLAGLPVWAGTGAPGETLRSARRLARHGALGTLLCCNEAGSQWLVAVTLQPVRLTVVERGKDDALALRRLRRAAAVDRATPLERAVALAEALDVDAAGRRTFAVLHRLLDQAVGLLPGSVPVEDRHAWTLAQITRLLFLRFVESEGWLDGNPRFLAAAFDRCLATRRDPTRDLLHPLFFGTLNRERNARSRLARAFGSVPFLNGGLFEPHAVERAHRLHLPAAYWRMTFEALVDRVDVTLDAGTEDGRVTPELLGRVFEGVMRPAERRQRGTFFTPPELVAALVLDALVCHLAPALSESESRVERRIADPDPDLLRRLARITVLDPAVGSGAFLIGALALLHGPGPRDPARVRHVVTRCLFGIDLHPAAVRICELRLWLEVLRTMRGRAPERVPPLPNLDACVRAGDALIDPMLGGLASARAAAMIRKRQQLMLGLHGSVKRNAVAAARTAERRAVIEALRHQEASLDHDIEELFATARATTLFGDRSAPSASLRRRLVRLRQERMRLRTVRRELARDQSATPFAVATAFAPVFARSGGFDLVVGNPPWVRAERLAPEIRSALAERYRWWRSGTGRGWRHLPDLSVAFVERGYGLLAPGGTLAFLVPAKLATAGYAASCRAALAGGATIHRVADLADDPRAGFEATTYPLALVASRRPPRSTHVLRLGLGSAAPSQLQSCWPGSAAWLTAPPQAQLLATRLATDYPRLGEQVSPQLGVKTGANVAFLDPPAELQAWCRPAIRGRDVRPFRAAAGTVILWPANERGVPWAKLPISVAEHLEQHIARLRRRADQQTGPWWRLFRTRAATAAHRVVWRDLASGLQAAVITDPHPVPLNTCYVAAVASAEIAGSLAAWLNSTPIRALARLAAEPAAGGCARFAARTIRSLPLPPSVLGHPVLASFANAAADHDVQSDLDHLAARLLRLTANEQDLLRGLASHRR